MGEGSAVKVCAWCGAPLRQRHRVVCDNGYCGDEWERHGRGPSAAIVEHRRAHVERQPRGCATMEQFIAAGGVVYRGEAELA